MNIDANQKVENEIIEKAKYCLKCKNKPCSNACPMHTNIPGFISEIEKGNIKEAYKILINNNIFSHICSIVCPQEKQCEGSCIRGIKQTSTEIGKLEEYVNKWAEENLEKIDFKIENKIDKKIAVIGSGPAGMQCAFDLKRKGYHVTVFEKEKNIGGILNYGIPDFRLNKSYLNNIVDLLEKIGIEFKTEKELGKDIHIKELKDKYDFIFIGIGAEIPSKYDLGDFESIYEPDIFLKAYNNNQFISGLGDVAIIGGGNVAMDCSRAALRMGANSSTIIYRRDEKYMPASIKELEDAISEGVRKEFTTRVIKASGNKKIESLKCIKTEIIDGKAIDIPNTEFDFKANTVIFAIGQKPNKEVLEKEGLKVNNWGQLEVDESGMTNIENVYAGGDVSEDKATVCVALGSARRVANSIDKKIKGE